MISRLGQAMPRFLAGTSVAGNGMRERLQAATFAMFGVVTAIGLVLVGIAYNQSWPDFADSPIPGIPTERIGKATVVAGAVHGQAGSGNGASHRSAPAGRAAVVPDRSSASHGSPQQLPAPAGGGPGPSPSGQGGVDVPVAQAPAPVGHSPTPAPPAPVAAESPPAATPVASSPPAAEPADAASVPANGKSKGHEKAEKPAKPEKAERPRGKPAPVAPSVPPPPSVPAPGAATPEAPGPAAGPGNGSGKGNAKGHEK
jgi:hypothetical protein